MSRVVIVEKNKDGKIELSKDELEKMLNDAYDQGYSDGKGRYDTITYPKYPYITCTSSTTDKSDSSTSADVLAR